MHFSLFWHFPHLIKFQNGIYVLLFPVLTFGTILAVHFHHFSTHATYGTLVHVICDFRCIENRFTAPEMRCLKKRANSDCLEIRLTSYISQDNSNSEIRFIIRDLENKFQIFNRDNNFLTEITILLFFLKLEFLGSYNINCVSCVIMCCMNYVICMLGSIGESVKH